MYGIQQKSEALDSFEEKICPKCKSGNISSQKLNSNCCGVSEYLFECHTCGYKDRYSIKSSHSSCVNYMKRDEIYQDIDEKSIKL
jgi:RNase P subunit RPR2